MAKHKQRHRPAAGIEIVYTDEHYSAVALCDPAFPHDSISVRIYEKAHRDFLFEALSVGLHFWCKRCERKHLLAWWKYNRELQADAPPYKVLCEDATDLWIVRADERIPDHLKARSIYTITSDHIELIARIAGYINNRQS